MIKMILWMIPEYPKSREIQTECVGRVMDVMLNCGWLMLQHPNVSSWQIQNTNQDKNGSPHRLQPRAVPKRVFCDIQSVNLCSV